MLNIWCSLHWYMSYQAEQIERKKIYDYGRKIKEVSGLAV